MKKIFFAAVTVIMCLTAIVFGGGSFDTTDSNRFVVITSKAQLDEYVASHSGDVMNVPANESSKYDDKFFEANALVVFVTDGMSGSIKVEYEGYELKGNELHVKVKELSPQIHTMDLRYNTLYATISQEQAKTVKKVVIDSYRVEI